MIETSWDILHKMLPPVVCVRVLSPLSIGISTMSPLPFGILEEVHEHAHYENNIERLVDAVRQNL